SSGDRVVSPGYRDRQGCQLVADRELAPVGGGERARVSKRRTGRDTGAGWRSRANTRMYVPLLPPGRSRSLHPAAKYGRRRPSNRRTAAAGAKRQRVCENLRLVRHQRPSERVPARSRLAVYRRSTPEVRTRSLPMGLGLQPVPGRRLVRAGDPQPRARRTSARRLRASHGWQPAEAAALTASELLSLVTASRRRLVWRCGMFEAQPHQRGICSSTTASSGSSRSFSKLARTYASAAATSSRCAPREALTSTTSPVVT